MLSGRWVLLRVTRKEEGCRVLTLSSLLFFYYSFFEFLLKSRRRTYEGKKEEKGSQLRSLHMDDRGLNKHNAIMFLNNKTIGISWDIPLSVVCRTCKERAEGEWRRRRREKRKKVHSTQHNSIGRERANILNIYGSTFIDIWICYSHFIRRRFHSLLPQHTEVDFNSTRHWS